jgi:hypothetical protein
MDPIDEALSAVFDDALADETAIEAAVPASDDAPDEEVIADTATEDTDETAAPDETEDAEPLSAETADPEPEPAAEPVAPQAAEPAKPSWESDENPYFVQAKKAEQLRAALLERQRQEATAKRIRDLSDDDPARIAEIQSLVQENVTPYVGQIGRLETELETAAKLATVYDEAAQSILPPDLLSKIQTEVHRLMTMPGNPQSIKLDIETRKQERAAYQAELAARDREIAELRKQVTAKAQVADRAARKADVVASSPGNVGTGARDRFNAATTYDDAIDAILSDLPGRAA